MENEKSLIAVAEELGLQLNKDDPGPDKQVLIDRINYLVIHDFNKLVQLLYRMDVSEEKLNALLKQYAGRDAGEIIAALMIERELQRIRSRQQFKMKDDETDEAERW